MIFDRVLENSPNMGGGNIFDGKSKLL